jgi:hypothetical protein
MLLHDERNWLPVMNAGPQKQCPFCAEMIATTAKLCPRCRRWLTWCSFRHPFVFIGMHLFLYGFLCFWVVNSFQRMFNPTPYYTEFRDSLRVLESEVNWVKGEKDMRIYLTGILTNQSPVAWKDIELECRCFDRNGVMVDAANTRASLTIQPNDDSAFRAWITPIRPTNDYASFKLLVSTARNAKGPF